MVRVPLVVSGRLGTHPHKSKLLLGCWSQTLQTLPFPYPAGLWGPKGACAIWLCPGPVKVPFPLCGWLSCSSTPVPLPQGPSLLFPLGTLLPQSLCSLKVSAPSRSLCLLFPEPAMFFLLGRLMASTLLPCLPPSLPTSLPPSLSFFLSLFRCQLVREAFPA